MPGCGTVICCILWIMSCVVIISRLLLLLSCVSTMPRMFLEFAGGKYNDKQVIFFSFPCFIFFINHQNKVLAARLLLLTNQTRIFLWSVFFYKLNISSIFQCECLTKFTYAEYNYTIHFWSAFTHSYTIANNTHWNLPFYKYLKMRTDFLRCSFPATETETESACWRPSIMPLTNNIDVAIQCVYIKKNILSV